jgi:hypothetical protein
MTWANYGLGRDKWQIDHIRPVSSFDPTTHPSVVNALSNLRPMWAVTRVVDGIEYEGNMNKHARWDGRMEAP